MRRSLLGLLRDSEPLVLVIIFYAINSQYLIPTLFVAYMNPENNTVAWAVT